jgi:hypothetical protein
MFQAGNLEKKRSEGMYRKGLMPLMYGGQQISYNFEMPGNVEVDTGAPEQQMAHIDK